MEIATIICLKILGPYYLLMSLALCFNSESLKRIVKKISEDESDLFQWGFISFIIGVSMLQFHNFWADIPEILVSLIAWGALIKGSVFILFPDYSQSLISLVTRPLIIMKGVIAFAIGIYFCRLVFFSTLSFI